MTDDELQAIRERFYIATGWPLTDGARGASLADIPALLAEIERLNATLSRITEAWTTINQKRGQLIRAKVNGVATAEELIQLEVLQWVAGLYVDAVAPRSLDSSELTEVLYLLGEKP